MPEVAMRILRPLSEETRSPLLRAVLRSAREDRGARDGRERALVALGLGTLSVGAAASVAGSASAKTSAAVGSVAPPAAKAGIVVLVKWVGLAAIGGLVAGGSLSIGAARHATRAAVTAAPVPGDVGGVPAVVARSDNDVVPPGPSLPESDSPSTATPPQRSRPAPAGLRASPGGGKAGRDSVGLQLDALAEVRAALLAGQPARALELLDAFDRHHRASPLAEEVSVLRIDALLDAGRTVEAATAGEAFLAAYPGSAYARHVRSRLKSP
jgi:hypothetical protein